MLLFGSGLTLNSIIDVQKAGSLLALRSFITLQNLFVSVVNSIVTGQILLMYFKAKEFITADATPNLIAYKFPSAKESAHSWFYLYDLVSMILNPHEATLKPYHKLVLKTKIYINSQKPQIIHIVYC